ncbi:glycosyltransferase family 4 protein [Oceanidesulfovibrio marinus]|uniref:Glycosyltransferase family 4 protein n=1 Tax=Oceanidesulfovibrio marinus TaxID=370038 RepID=A0ABX6NGW3_9BACT|nr:glycosyltransferase family 4 protein [Oceanidesulfovibrio marinus]QJT09802.1 glycosyltransferase family 4 protein [Oceanidesulfovibrio marinus]
MQIIFVSYYDFKVQSAIHIFNIANELCKIGVDCTVCVTENVELVHNIGKPLFSCMTHEEILAPDFTVQDPKNTLVHAWTPRENVRQCTLALCEKLGCRYMIHLEDNELSVLEFVLGVSMEQALAMPREEVDALMPAPGELPCTHPHYFQSFLEGAAGLSVIIETLNDFKPDHVPSVVLWPSCESSMFLNARCDRNLRRDLGIGEGERVIFYPGAVSEPNKEDVLSLYKAVALLNQKGHSFRLLRTGVDFCDLGIGPELNEHVISLGFRPREEIPQYLGMADVLVQPGAPGHFNDYRFPSKLPEFFYAGKPVVMGRTNLGGMIRDGVDALLMERGDPDEIVEKVVLLTENEELAATLGKNALAFAEKHFNWRKTAAELHAFYKSIL